MITTLLLDILNFFWYGLIELLWPQSIAGFDLTTFGQNIASLFASILPFFRMINALVPVDTIFVLFLIFLLMHLILYLFRVGKFVLSILRPGI